MPSSRGSSLSRGQTQVSHIASGSFTIWATREAQEYWSGQPIPSPGDLPDPGIEPGSPPLQVNSLPAELSEKPTVEGGKPQIKTFCLNEMSAGRQSACAG